MNEAEELTADLRSAIKQAILDMSTKVDVVKRPDHSLEFEVTPDTIADAATDAVMELVSDRLAASREAVPELLDALREARELLDESNALLTCAMDIHRDPGFHSEYQRELLKDDADEIEALRKRLRVWLSEHPGSGGNRP